MLKKSLALLLGTMSLFSCKAEKKMTTDKPNIIIILADDLGYGDVKTLNSNSKIPTPNLDQFASQGITFTDAHTPSSVCTPTRYGLLTGRYCWRTRLKKGVLRGYDKPLIEEGRSTIASYLRSNGYATGVVGKWHLGLGFEKDSQKSKKHKPVYDITKPLFSTPNNIGFDYSYVLPASLDFAPYVYIRNNQVTESNFVEVPHTDFPLLRRKGLKSKSLEFDGVLDDFLVEAKSFIRKETQKDKPFFLYFPFTAPHTPLVPRDDFKGKSGKGVYGDFVMQVDWTAGEIFKLLDELDIADNTLVIFTSDNGSPMARMDGATGPDHITYDSIQYYNGNNHQANHIFSGIKGDVLEGGHRVPFFVRWPNLLKPGKNENSTICLTDIFETITHVIGEQKPKGSAEDSYSFWPILTGEKKKIDRPAIIHHSGKGMFAMRKDDWKLILGNGSGARTEPVGVPFEGPYQLFKIADDITEKNNLIETETEVLKDMQKTFEEIRGDD